MKKLAMISMVVLGISAAAWGADQTPSAGDVDAAVAALKASGQPVCMADLAPTVPDSQNAAVLYMQAAKMLSTSRNDVYLLYNLIDPAFRVRNHKLGARARTLVAGYSGVIDTVERASTMPQCRFPLGAGRAHGSQAFAGYDDAHLLTSFLSTAAFIKAKDGKPEDAVRCLELAMKIAESLKDEPSGFGFATRNICHATVGSALKEILSAGSLNDKQCKRLFDYLSLVDYYPGYKNSLIGERAVLIEARERERKPAAQGSQQENGKVKSSGSPEVCALEDREMKMMQSLIDRCEVPCRDAAPAVPVYTITDPSLRESAIYERIAVSRDRYQAQIGGEAMLLALGAYQSKFHLYPKSLEELKSKLGWKLPTDPFSGLDFKYRPMGKGFLLYSIGANLKDDNGVEPGAREAGDGGDIVWKQIAAPEKATAVKTAKPAAPGQKTYRPGKAAHRQLHR